MPRTNTNPRDFTGLQKERLSQANKAEAKVAQERMSTITPLAFDDEVSDVEETQGDLSPIKYENEDGTVTQVEQVAVSFRVNTDLEDVTIGAGNTYTFLVGHLYKESKEVYDHLDTKGYVWH